MVFVLLFSSRNRESGFCFIFSLIFFLLGLLMMRADMRLGYSICQSTQFSGFNCLTRLNCFWMLWRKKMWCYV